MRLRTSSSHKEGGRRFWSILTKKFIGAAGHLRSLITVNVEAVAVKGKMQFREVPGTEHEWPTELVLLALGFIGPEPDGVIAQLGVELDRFGNVKSDQNYMTSVPGVFSAGDMRRGQSLVVWAISEGREAARGVDLYLMGYSELPSKGNVDLPRI
jgi:glutamate synthase (NADPH) small chain